MMSLYQTLTEPEEVEGNDSPSGSEGNQDGDDSDQASHEPSQTNAMHQSCDATMMGNASSLSSPTRFQTWRQAHTAYCREKRVLRASLQQIIQEYYPDDYEIPWDLPPLQQVVTTCDQLPSSLTSEPVTTTPTNLESSNGNVSPGIASSVFHFTKKLVLSAISYEEDVVDEESLIPSANDDAFVHNNATVAASSPQAALVDMSVPVVHVDRTLACLRRLDSRLSEQLSAAAARPGQSDHLWILPRADWNSWLQNNDTAEKGDCVVPFQTLATADLDWLLQVLVQQGRATLLSRPNQQDLIVISADCSKTTDDEDAATMTTTSREVDIAVTLWDLQSAKTKMTHLIDEWNQEAELCRRRALACKKKKDKDATNQALLLLKKRKLLEQQLSLIHI